MIELSTPPMTWLSGPMMPIVAATAVRARNSGTPAATSAPKAISRMIKVIGSDVFRALPKSSVTTLLICWFAAGVPELPDGEAGVRLFETAATAATAA